MKRKLLSFLLALTMCVTFVPSLSAFVDESSTWSILIYMCGSDLEGAYVLKTTALLDILDNDLPNNLKLAVYTGDSSSWDINGASEAF